MPMQLLQMSLELVPHSPPWNELGCCSTFYKSHDLVGPRVSNLTILTENKYLNLIHLIGKADLFLSPISLLVTSRKENSSSGIYRTLLDNPPTQKHSLVLSRATQMSTNKYARFSRTLHEI